MAQQDKNQQASEPRRRRLREPRQPYATEIRTIRPAWPPIREAITICQQVPSGWKFQPLRWDHPNELRGAALPCDRRMFSVIDDLGLQRGLTARLREAGIIYIGELVELDRVVIASKPRVGVGAIRMIESALEKWGLRLGMRGLQFIAPAPENPLVRRVLARLHLDLDASALASPLAAPERMAS